MGHQCFYCGIALDMGVEESAPNRYTRDHMTPRSRGGRGADNLVDCCAKCNSQKGNKTVEEYRAYLISRTPVGYLHHVLRCLARHVLVMEEDRKVIEEVMTRVTPCPTHKFHGEASQ